jgi:hypothetical protein
MQSPHPKIADNINTPWHVSMAFPESVGEVHTPSDALRPGLNQRQKRRVANAAFGTRV